MFLGNRRIQYWSLDNQITKLEQLLPLLQLNYAKDNDQFLYKHAWMPSNGLTVSDKFNIGKVEVANEEYRCILAFAKTEMPQVASEFIGQVSREIAISHSLNPVIFIEVSNKIRVIVSASSSCFSRIRSSLMRYIDKKVNLWGPVDYKSNKLDKDFFYWLLNKKGKKITSEDDTYQILDVNGFKSHTDKELQKYQGTGNSIDTVVPVQAMVCLNNNFTGLALVTRNQDDLTISFSLSNDWEIKIDIDKTFTLDKNKKMIFIDNFDPIVLLLYLHVIPKIYGQFNADKLWTTERVDFKKKVAVKAIKEILGETGLTIPELGQMLA